MHISNTIICYFSYYESFLGKINSSIVLSRLGDFGKELTIHIIIISIVFLDVRKTYQQNVL